MSPDSRPVTYEPPRIERRDSVGSPLIGANGSSLPGTAP
jgi:hypothetical protein